MHTRYSISINQKKITNVVNPIKRFDTSLKCMILRNIFGKHFVGNMNEILDSLPWFIFNKSLWNGLFELEFNYPRNIFISDDLPEITLIYCHVLRLIWFFLQLILYQVIYQVISISISNLFFAVQGGIQLLSFYICLFS